MGAKFKKMIKVNAKVYFLIKITQSIAVRICFILSPGTACLVNGK